MLLTVEAYNFLIHKYLKIDVNKESLLVIGDSATGKSTLSRLILAHKGLADYPANPLSDGENEGFTKTTDLAPDGKMYTTLRKFVRLPDGTVKLDRFEVRGPDNRKKSLEEVMEVAFDGMFTNPRFDYIGYFYRTAGPASRWNYFVKAIGGDVIDNNKKEIKALEKQRGELDTPRSTQKALWEQVTSTKETIEADTAYYKQERTTEEAEMARKEHLKKKLPLDAHQAKLEAHAEALDLVSQNKRAIIKFQEEVDDIDRQIAELQKKRLEKTHSITSCNNLIAEQSRKAMTDAALTKLGKKIIADETHNKKIEAEAEQIYQDKIQEIITFQTDKAKFFGGFRAFIEYEKLDAQWKELDNQIKAKKKENDETFRSLLPLPELTIGGTEDDPIILYKGRPFDRENLSTGEQIEITAAIQIQLNPNADNFIVIPNAADLGSKLKEVQKTLKKFNIQYLVEMTKPDEEFRVEIIEPEPKTKKKKK